jgi:SpoVK/Ycf46/Vps4 family AAA+-type ATPase
LNVTYYSGPGSDYETTARLIIVRRENASEALRLVEELDRTDSKPRLHVVGSSNRRIVGCHWDDLVLDYKVRTMLRDDFESFFERQAWFRENKLPFRRGYLLHGPPGSGKSTAIRAMMTSRGLTAYTMALFTEQQDDNDLNNLFELAVKNRPSMVLLEDLDRAFPKPAKPRAASVCKPCLMPLTAWAQVKESSWSQPPTNPPSSTRLFCADQDVLTESSTSLTRVLS